MSLSTALIPTADWSGPAWWFVFFPLVWFGFFFLLFFVLRRFGSWGRGPCRPRRCPRSAPAEEEGSS